MSLKTVVEKAQRDVKPGEEIKGAFIANCMPAIIWYFIIGPLAAIMMRQYIVTLTDRRIYFTSLNMFQKIIVTDDFEYTEIECPPFKGKFFTRIAKFNLNGRNLKLTIPFRKKNKENILGPETLEYLLGKLEQ